jgi:hypothetical protein
MQLHIQELRQECVCADAMMAEVKNTCSFTFTPPVGLQSVGFGIGLHLIPVNLCVMPLYVFVCTHTQICVRVTENVKVNLSLFLTKYQAMKTYWVVDV